MLTQKEEKKEEVKGDGKLSIKEERKSSVVQEKVQLKTTERKTSIKEETPQVRMFKYSNDTSKRVNIREHKHTIQNKPLVYTAFQ